MVKSVGAMQGREFMSKGQQQVIRKHTEILGKRIKSTGILGKSLSRGLV